MFIVFSIISKLRNIRCFWKIVILSIFNSIYLQYLTKYEINISFCWN